MAQSPQIDRNKTVSLDPTFVIESQLEDDVFETSKDFESNNCLRTTANITPRHRECSCTSTSAVNDEPILRRPQQLERPPSYIEPSRNRPSSIHHAHSVPDFHTYRKQTERNISKDSVNDRSFRPPANSTSTQPRHFSDSVSVVNDDVILRRPHQLDRPPSIVESFKNGQNIHHAHSNSDSSRSQYARSISKEPTKLVPMAINSRPRSQTFSRSYDESNQMSTRPSSPQDDNNQYQLSPTRYQNGGFINGGFEVCGDDFGSHKGNRLTQDVSSGSHQQQPSSPRERKEMFTDTLSTSLSTIYAVLIVTLGVSVYVIDYLEVGEEKLEDLAVMFSLVLLGLALLYLLYLVIDIAIYKHKKDIYEQLMDKMTVNHMEMKQTSEGIAYDPSLQKALVLKKQLDHRYCFNMDRHSSNFYLKIGAIGFCFGHLIHTCLLITYRALLITPENNEKGCTSIASFTLEVAYPLYSVILLFFIFKYSNVIINKHRDFHRFGFMHCLSASLCFWIWTIFGETAEYIHYQNLKYYNDASKTEHSPETFLRNSTYKELRIVVTPKRFTKMCDNEELNVVYQNYSPYLYPFSVEFSILVVGILYIVWKNIGLCNPGESEKGDHHGEDSRECKSYKSDEQESNVTIHVDCHAANKGLFGGFIALVFVVLSVILFFITTHSSNDTELGQTGYIINNITTLAILLCMTVATVLAYIQIVKLDVNHQAHNSMDNFLCLMCLPAFFVYGIFSIIPAMMNGYITISLKIIVQIIQVLIQTPFIVDGMARSSNTKELRKKKPGREFVTFLVICNVAMWIMLTFKVKSHGLDQYRQDFYSKEVWSIVGHICLPLIMFYRFHSSVCLGDIWKYAYVPEGH